MKANSIIKMFMFLCHGMFTMYFAKVDGPLFSLGASGKIGDAMVFFGWKGRNVVRKWLKPTNPKSDTQGFVRVALNVIGKWIKRVDAKSKGSTVDSVIYLAGTASAPAGQIWNAWLNQGWLDLFQSAGTFITGSFTDMIDSYSSLGTDELASFAAEATSLLMEDSAFAYGYTTNIPAGFKLYAGAKACYAKSIIGSAPYNTSPDSWGTADIGSFADDHTA